MRIAPLIALVIAALGPTAAAAGPMECSRLTRQIEHYSGMVERARELERPVWAERTQDHVDRLIVRRSALCPEYADDEAALQAFADLLRTAARAALTYFTFGAF